MIEFFELVLRKWPYLLVGPVPTLACLFMAWYCSSWRRWLAVWLAIMAGLIVVFDCFALGLHGRTVLPFLLSTPFILLGNEILLAVELVRKRGVALAESSSEKLPEPTSKPTESEATGGSTHRLKWLTFGLLACLIPIVVIGGLATFTIRPYHPEELRIYCIGSAFLYGAQFPIVFNFGQPRWLGGIVLFILSCVAIWVSFGLYGLLLLNSF